MCKVETFYQIVIRELHEAYTETGEDMFYETLKVLEERFDCSLAHCRENEDGEADRLLAEEMEYDNQRHND